MNDRSKELWIFAYGSLIWRPGFAYQQRLVGRVDGYSRRFWQASEDHRGVVGNPGRVVTLIQSEHEHCEGVAYLVAPADQGAVLELLDTREKGGYSPIESEFFARDGRRMRCRVYIGEPNNSHFVNTESAREIANVARQARGPSGHNAEYVLRLAEALCDLEIYDRHVIDVANYLVDPHDVLREAAQAK